MAHVKSTYFCCKIALCSIKHIKHKSYINTSSVNPIGLYFKASEYFNNGPVLHDYRKVKQISHKQDLFHIRNFKSDVKKFSEKTIGEIYSHPGIKDALLNNKFDNKYRNVLT